MQKIKNKKVIELTKDESGEQIIKEFVGLTAKPFSYLKESKRYKKGVMKRKVKFQDYKNCLRVAKIENKKLVRKEKN